ncbi:hypothetical protein NKI51_06630 [Mesorhizobium australicum]|uniref:hypothetical protein n=1 Tax=Mesorhizobium TaxID=68287 RepID=UPI0003CF2EEE|nr:MULTISPECIES: hypothetical protein [unclassified Mesorhizobium]ESY88022.1 hypothetical protein X739_04735 [Mesorhizobium sp. LNHC220B00]ESY93916.1 hypothetical protein X741_16980 [Mesorhizobium sp. LNHC229A00]ESZ01061.1 hypothetical protein X738_04215 [Mesorhizobium sp. LNHC209A00]
MPGRDISIFDLDALREAFMKSVRENNVSPAEWGEHAQWFIQQLAVHKLSEVAVSQITGAADDSQQ